MACPSPIRFLDYHDFGEHFTSPSFLNLPPLSDETLPVKSKSRTYVGAPKDFFIAPIFAARKQFGPRKVEIKSLGKIYLVGGFDPYDRDARPPALDVRHARALFALLSFRKKNRERAQALGRLEEYDPRSIFFSMDDLCRAYASSNGGRYSRDLLKIVGDIAKAYICITDTITGRTFVYRLIERVAMEPKFIKRRDSNMAQSLQMEMWYHCCQLSPEFEQMLQNTAELQYLKLEVFTAIRSPIAQAIYLYIPSRAAHHSEISPFEIKLTTLMNEISLLPVPVHKSVRKKAFIQHEDEGRSILQQLDGLETYKWRFRVKLVDTVANDDFKLLCWIESDPALLLPEPREDSKLYQAFLQGGRVREDWMQMIKRVGPLSNYEQDLLQIAGIEIEHNRRFFEQAKAILGSLLFKEVLAEVKCDHLEGIKARKSPTAKLIYRLMTVIKLGIGVSKG